MKHKTEQPIADESGTAVGSAPPVRKRLSRRAELANVARFTPEGRRLTALVESWDADAVTAIRSTLRIAADSMPPRSLRLIVQLINDASIDLGSEAHAWLRRRCEQRTTKSGD